MSNSQMVDASEVQALTTQIQLLLASTVVYFYDWLVTIGPEVDYIWTPKWTLATWIFIISRYTMLARLVLQLLPIPNYYTSCVLQLHLEDVCTLVQILTSGLFTALRTYALCSKRMWLLVIILGLAAVVPGALNMMLFIKGSIVFQIASVCIRNTSFTPEQILRFSLLSRISVTVTDAVALTMAWRKAGRALQRSGYTSKPSLAEVLTREGTGVFLLLLLLNVYGILIENIPHLRAATGGDTSMIVLSTIIMCRFMLSMRQTSDRYRTNDSTISGSHTTQFNSTVITGNLGESSELEDVGNASGEDPDDHSNGPLSTGTEEGNSV